MMERYELNARGKGGLMGVRYSDCELIGNIMIDITHERIFPNT